MSQELDVAVLTGSHPFHVRPFYDFIHGLDGVRPYIQSFDDWLTAAGFEDSDQEERDSYDVTLFYTMLRGVSEGKSRACIEHLFDSGQPVFVLHHALLNYREDDWWAEVVGLPDRSFSSDIWLGSYRVDVNEDHPASAGLEDFEIYDETFSLSDCNADCDVLLTTAKEGSMHTLAWSRIHGNSRVFCLQLGHDARSWENPAFRTVVQNGLRWCAGETAGADQGVRF
ncbi:MAG: ThuA domain-containing protein [Gammaproteobacteria bacterium]|nr:ThuA domain-containing protein [Gammaproteobacteria bacterium]